MLTFRPLINFTVVNSIYYLGEDIESCIRPNHTIYHPKYDRHRFEISLKAELQKANRNISLVMNEHDQGPNGLVIGKVTAAI